MFRIRPLTFLVALVAISPVLTLGTELEEDYISRPGWCPGLPGPSIQAEHMQWHTIVWPVGVGGKEFVEFHDEFLAQSDDFRLYGFDLPVGPDVDPDPAAVAIVAQPGNLLKYGHTNLNGYVRPPAHDVTAVDGRQQVWTARTANLTLGNPLFHGYTANGIGAAMDGLFHGAGHMTIAMHDRNPAPGDMGNTTDATRDGAFFQWHKNIDNIYHEWSVGQYQLINKAGTPIYFNVAEAPSAWPEASSTNVARPTSIRAPIRPRPTMGGYSAHRLGHLRRRQQQQQPAVRVRDPALERRGTARLGYGRLDGLEPSAQWLVFLGDAGFPGSGGHGRAGAGSGGSWWVHFPVPGWRRE
jgi:hypothetical protein